MTVFYIDTEYNEGNYYIGDIFEVACLSSNDKLFHSYINIPTNVSRYVQQLCDVDPSILRQSPSFNAVIDGLIEFITKEEIHGSQTTLIGHGAFLSDFPLIIANCIKNSYDHSSMKEFKFVDSMEAFRDGGYDRPGLDSLSTSRRTTHSAAQDVRLLKDIVSTHPNIRYKLYTYDDILNHLAIKMPLRIREIQAEAQKRCYEDFEQFLTKHVKMKTALNKNHLMKIVNRYYYDCLYI